ncbi:hypothetical protein N0V88_004431 [Collariella sp. IMI 366227]|nr:hypothetical protein N0V88_004431 [Collariella sp. IMI 366227]
MPPRSSLTSSFSITDANNEVICPLRNQDGSSCRKRCIGEKRYRSMQEHIRRAHPEHYIAKLPATEESFLLMISTSPSERPQASTSAGPPHASQARGPSHSFRRDESNGPGTPRRYEDYSGGAMFPAAAALAQLHSNHKSDSGWDSDGSKGPSSDWLHRIQNDGNPDYLRPGGFDRKALSAEPSADYGKRWEDLIDAAASATEDIDEDRTPVSLRFPSSMLDPRLTSQMPRSPVSIQRSSLPPLTQNAFASYQASPSTAL